LGLKNRLATGAGHGRIDPGFGGAIARRMVAAQPGG